ncbi:DedA family protein [Brachybacterium sp. GCM10030267]|uniref:DedA family protein n=1 Tax=unclassified Brachybacterium TaxID=2623841 RepID=UPI00361F9394
MDSVMQLVETVMASPWLYLVVFLVVAIDSVLPVVPGETVVITAGAYAVVQSSPEAQWLLLVAIAGAVAGDITSHHVGRGAGPLTRRLRRNRVGEKLFGWAENGLMTRGGMIIIAARFIPGGRTATSIASGMIGYPRPRFIGYSLLAGTAWATYNVAIGMLGGFAFREQPLLGVAIGVGLALVVGLIIERVRIARERRQGRASGTAAAAAPGAAASADGAPTPAARTQSEHDEVAGRRAQGTEPREPDDTAEQERIYAGD